MIISRTPFRISFFGGGTDYPGWYRRNGGAVLATTINKYCFLTCRYLPPFFEHRIRVVYSKIENCQDRDEIEHPAVREVLRFLEIERGVEIHHDGDLPARSGLGSSSSFTVGLLHALYALKGQIPSKHQLATESIHVEQEMIKENVGSQDQVSAAYGGFNHVTFDTNGEIAVRPLTLARERIRELDSHLVLFYTGIKRTASKIAADYVQEIESKDRQLRELHGLVERGIEILRDGGDLGRFGQLLHEGWELKRSMSARISNDTVEDIYARARAAGALGGKLIGAGGGGFLLLFVHPPDQERVRQELKQLICVPFNFEFSGSQIIFFDREEDFSEAEKARRCQHVESFRELDGEPRPGGGG